VGSHANRARGHPRVPPPSTRADGPGYPPSGVSPKFYRRFLLIVISLISGIKSGCDQDYREPLILKLGASSGDHPKMGVPNCEIIWG
jgi:hypothetical protein